MTERSRMDYMNDIATGKGICMAINDHMHSYSKHTTYTALVFSNRIAGSVCSITKTTDTLKKANDEVRLSNMDIEDCEAVSRKLYEECVPNLVNVNTLMRQAILKHSVSP